MSEGVAFPEGIVDAALENNKHQKALELKLVELEEEWFARLKLLAKERLEVLLEVYSQMDARRSVGHLGTRVTGEKLKLEMEKESLKMKAFHTKKLNKYELQNDELSKVPLHFPNHDRVSTSDALALSLSHISAFARSWSLSSSSDSLLSAGETKQDLVNQLNRSLRNSLPFRSPIVTGRKRRRRAKRRSKEGQRGTVSVTNLPHLPIQPQSQRQPPTADILEAAKPPKQKSEITLPPIKDATFQASRRSRRVVFNDDNESEESKPIPLNTFSGAPTEKRVKNPRFMFPGIV